MSFLAFPLAAAALIAPWISADDGDSGAVAAPRPAAWASPLPEISGLPNAWRVTDSFLRGAQPAPEGFAQLRQRGVKTVLNLRTLHSDRELCAAAGLAYVKVSVQSWETEREEILDVLEVLTDPARQPVFLHCQHGADRTGTMTALYRMVVQGWARDEAIAEMTTGGFGFHSIWVNLVSSLREIDIVQLRVDLGGRQQRSQEEAARLAIASSWRDHIAAAQGKDLDATMEIYADDVVYIVGETHIRGKAALRQHEQRSLDGGTVVNALHTTDSLRVLGDSAFEIGSIVGPVAEGDEPARIVDFAFMARWVRGADGRWRMQTLVGQF